MDHIALEKYNDPLVRLVVAAGPARAPRRFWTSVAALLQEIHNVASVEIDYSDGFAAGIVRVGEGSGVGASTEYVWQGDDDRYARVVVSPAIPDVTLLEREVIAAAELAQLVGRRALLEHERRIGTFLVELSHWMHSAHADPRALLHYALDGAVGLVNAHGGVIVECANRVCAVTAAVGAAEPLAAPGPLSDSVFERVMTTGDPFLSSRVGTEQGFPTGDGLADRLRAGIIVPLGARDGAIGALAAVRIAGEEHGDEPFARTDADHLAMVASQIGTALQLGRAIEAAREAAQRLRAMVDGSPLPLVLVDHTGAVREANRAWAALFAVEDPAALRGRNLDAFPLTLDRATPAEAIHMSASGVPWRGRAEVRCDGEHRKCDAIFTTLDGDAGEVLVALHDRTEEIRSMREEIAKEKLATLETLAHGVAHEVNNPLAAIRMEAELLGFGSPPPEISQAVNVIITEVDRAARIAKSLLRLSRQADERMEAVALGGLLQNLIDVRSRVLASEGITLSGKIPADLPSVLARAGDLEQMLLHLVQNAEWAVEGRVNAAIEVTAVATDSGIRVMVDDTGPGVPPDLRQKIFDPFFSTKPPDKGRGLGLAMCQRVVSELGGKIWAEAGPLPGARFIVELPAA